jgi:xanthine dehydrogenase YagS FAD-binding subunit
MTVVHAATVADAQAHDGEFRAGGTDVEARRRLGLSHPVTIDLSRIPGLARIDSSPDDTRVGSMVRVATLARELAVDYPALALTASALANPHTRAVSTVGGNLLQQTRCWYYRTGNVDCFKTGGEGCPARAGIHHFGNIFDTSSCVAPHPSSLAVALLAYEADVVVHPERVMSIAELYDPVDPSREHTLAPREVLTAVMLPPPLANEAAGYARATSRMLAEWPLVEAVCRLVVEEARIVMARVAVGGVGPVPLRLSRVEEALVGAVADRQALELAAGISSHGVKPAPQAAFKVPLLEGTVLEAIERAVGIEVSGEGALHERGLTGLDSNR